MSLGVSWTHHARRDLRKLDKQTVHRIVDAVDRLATTGQGDVKRLAGIEPPEWRLRVGAWRIRFAYDAPRRGIVILRVLPRSSAYRN